MKKSIVSSILFVISFLSYISGQAQEIVTSVKRITNVIDSYPMLSPDGGKITFQSDRTGDVEIYIMNIDGSDIRQLTHSAGFDGCPKWSPDGKIIAFASERDKNSEIYRINADGSGEKRLTNDAGDDSHPHWFPDGSRIIFNSSRTSPNSATEWEEIFSMKIDGSDLKQITTFKTVTTYPSVSPDGTKLAFRKIVSGPAFNWNLSTNANNRDSEVFVSDINGQNAINLSNSPAFDGWPAWSPDSKMIVFSSNRRGPSSVGQLYITNIDGTSLRKLCENTASLAQPAWSKDGKKIYAFQLWETPEYEYGNILEIEVVRGL